MGNKSSRSDPSITSHVSQTVSSSCSVGLSRNEQTIEKFYITVTSGVHSGHKFSSHPERKSSHFIARDLLINRADSKRAIKLDIFSSNE
uniref:Uncharacterized protein n=1 Tax=Romanomermis culicivorax TaxID=13658 RepID=A0A915KF10_ROMCU